MTPSARARANAAPEARGRHTAPGGAAGRRFTLIEVAVVLVILGLALALVAPKIGRLPRKVVVDGACAKVRTAFRDAGMKARAMAKPVRLVLDVEGKLFRIEDLPGAPAPEAAPPVSRDGDEDGAERPPPPGFLARLKQYELPRDLEWRLDDLQLGVEEKPSFSFYPDGSATGQAMQFTVRETRFNLDVDRLTGRPLLTEVPD